MSRAHTPGPWKAVEGGFIQASRDHAVNSMQLHDLDIAQVEVGGHGSEFFAGEPEANVKLIAAAPELAAACKSALQLAWEVGCESEDGVMTLLEDGRGDLYRQLSAALTKAGVL